MRNQGRFRVTSPAPALALLLACTVVACGTLSGPLDIEMWTSERPSAYAKPDYSGTVDFDRGVFAADVFGKHFVGKLEPGEHGDFKIHPQSQDGLTMDCNFTQLQPALWRGRCTDAGGQVIEMRAGRHWSV